MRYNIHTHQKIYFDEEYVEVGQMGTVYRTMFVVEDMLGTQTYTVSQQQKNMIEEMMDKGVMVDDILAYLEL